MFPHFEIAASILRPDAVVEIPETDEAYRTWIYTNPSGYVVNSLRNPRSGQPILHRAMCDSIAPRAAERWTTGDYIKVCSTRRYELDAWAREHGQRLRPCEFCDPP